MPGKLWNKENKDALDHQELFLWFWWILTWMLRNVVWEKVSMCIVRNQGIFFHWVDFIIAITIVHFLRRIMIRRLVEEVIRVSKKSVRCWENYLLGDETISVSLKTMKTSVFVFFSASVSFWSLDFFSIIKNDFYY